MAQTAAECASMTDPSAAKEWDQLVIKIGTLALAVGYLEMAIISMVCRILRKTEDDVGKRHPNAWWCAKLKEVASSSWSDAQKVDLSERLKKIRELYLQRNRLIHAALAVVADGSISGVPQGAIVDLRTYGIGFTKQQGNTWTIGVVGKRLNLHEIDELIQRINEARLGLAPYMELVDKIKHPPKPFPMPPEIGRLL
jgi:hypothetical protein